MQAGLSMWFRHIPISLPASQSLMTGGGGCDTSITPSIAPRITSFKTTTTMHATKPSTLHMHTCDVWSEVE